MHGIKIPQEDFALKMRGAYAQGGGGVFVGHYGSHCHNIARLK